MMASWVHHQGWVRLCMVKHCEPGAGLKRQSGIVTFAWRYAELLPSVAVRSFLF